MLTRRETMLGGLLTILWGSGACHGEDRPRRMRSRAGCSLEPDEAEPFLATATAQQAFATGCETVIASSGNRDFDFALARTLSHLTDTFGVLPGFAYYDDYDGENALATTVRKLARSDGSVLFGKRLFIGLMGQPEHPEVAVAAICAHEFAHILQFKRGIHRRLEAGQPTVKRTELHADFLAGYFAGLRKRERPDFPAAVFATTQFSSGDHDVHDRDHHGRPDERAAAVVRGFETSFKEGRSFNDAVQAGINYVMRL